MVKEAVVKEEAPRGLGTGGWRGGEGDGGRDAKDGGGLHLGGGGTGGGEGRRRRRKMTAAGGNWARAESSSVAVMKERAPRALQMAALKEAAGQRQRGDGTAAEGSQVVVKGTAQAGWAAAVEEIGAELCCAGRRARQLREKGDQWGRGEG